MSFIAKVSKIIAAMYLTVWLCWIIAKISILPKMCFNHFKYFTVKTYSILAISGSRVIYKTAKSVSCVMISNDNHIVSRMSNIPKKSICNRKKKYCHKKICLIHILHNYLPQKKIDDRVMFQENES